MSKPSNYHMIAVFPLCFLFINPSLYTPLSLTPSLLSLRLCLSNPPYRILALGPIVFLLILSFPLPPPLRPYLFFPLAQLFHLPLQEVALQH